MSEQLWVLFKDEEREGKKPSVCPQSRQFLRALDGFGLKKKKKKRMLTRCVGVVKGRLASIIGQTAPQLQSDGNLSQCVYREIVVRI